MSVINIEHISKLYGDRMVLDDLSCSVDFGDKIGIIGNRVCVPAGRCWCAGREMRRRTAGRSSFPEG